MARDTARQPRARLGAGLALLVVTLAVVGPALSPHDPTAFVSEPFDAPSPSTWLGTDGLGRDVLSRFLCGGLSLLAVALPATVLGVAVGVAIGLATAIVRGWQSEAVMRVLDVLMAFPQIVLALLFLTILGPQPWLLVLVVAAAHMPQTARVVHGVAVEVAERDFVRAAELIGTPWRTIMARDLLPNVSGPILVEVGLRFTYSIGIVAALSFLGFGRQPPDPDWGLMISENKIGLTLAPWGTLLPVLAIATLAIGVNLVVDSLGHAAARLSEHA